MEAIVEIANLKKRLFGARIGPEEYLIFELLQGCQPKVGDVVSYRNLYEMNIHLYRDLTQAQELKVRVRNVVGSLRKLRESCGVNAEG